MSIEQEKEGLKKVLEHLAASGWALRHVDDDGELHNVSTVDEAIEHASAVEHAWIHLMKEGKRGTLTLVWGNSPDELIADHTIGNGFEIAVDAALDAVFPEDVSHG